MSNPSPEVEYAFPEVFAPLFEDWRYKVFYGGRDSAKSWSVARYLILEGAERPIFVGCFREVQSSMRDSVYLLLCNQISELGLSDFYQIQHDGILAPNGTVFRFAGLSRMTRDSIKSYEGLDYAWVEEAHSVSARSWDILEPTVRKKGSQIIVTFNPELDTDDTYQRFVVNKTDEMSVTKVSFEDNPWRSEVLDKAREAMRINDPDKYRHVYLGECLAAMDGAIYAQEVSALRAANRLCNVPYDRMLKAHVIVDLGFNDCMSLLVAQRRASEIRVIRYIEDRFRFIPSYSEELKGLALNWGKVWLPHDGYATSVNGPSAERQFKDLGWQVERVPDIGLEQGIRKTREVFPRIWVDKDSASEPSKTTGATLVNRLARYRRRVNKDGQGSTPLHDDNSHGADGFRYLAVVADQLMNETRTGRDTNAQRLAEERQRMMSQ